VAFYSSTLATVGGLWEAGVRCIKYHLKKLVGVTAFTFEEVRTLITQVQAYLNSRPITAFSMSQMTPSTLVQKISRLVYLVHILLSLTCLICQSFVWVAALAADHTTFLAQGSTDYPSTA
jgi:hypothetical protein